MQSSSQIITNKSTSSFLQAGCHSCHPTNSVKALKGNITFDGLTPSSAGGLPTLSLTTNSSWLPWGRVAMPLISPLMPVPQKLVRFFIFNSCLKVIVIRLKHFAANSDLRKYFILRKCIVRLILLAIAELLV